MTAERTFTAILDPDGHGMTRDDLDLYVATLTLTRAQWRALFVIVPNPEQMDHRWWNAAPVLLAEAIRAELHHSEHRGVDPAEFADLCGSLAPPQGLALVDAVVRARDAGGDYDEALRRVGLLEAPGSSRELRPRLPHRLLSHLFLGGHHRWPPNPLPQKHPQSSARSPLAATFVRTNRHPACHRPVDG